MSSFIFKGKIELFPGPGGWHYIIVPADIAKITKTIAIRGLTPVKATIGNTSWNTSLLPYGDGRQFIALSKKVRTAENLALDSTVEVSFILRD